MDLNKLCGVNVRLPYIVYLSRFIQLLAIKQHFNAAANFDDFVFYYSVCKSLTLFILLFDTPKHEPNRLLLNIKSKILRETPSCQID